MTDPDRVAKGVAAGQTSPRAIRSGRGVNPSLPDDAGPRIASNREPVALPINRPTDRACQRPGTPLIDRAASPVRSVDHGLIVARVA